MQSRGAVSRLAIMLLSDEGPRTWRCTGREIRSRSFLACEPAVMRSVLDYAECRSATWGLSAFVAM